MVDLRWFGECLADHWQIEMIFAGAVDGDVIAGIGVSHDAGSWIVKQHARDPRVGFVGSIAADHDARMLRVAHTNAAAMMEADPSRAAGRI